MALDDKSNIPVSDSAATLHLSSRQFLCIGAALVIAHAVALASLAPQSYPREAVSDLFQLFLVVAVCVIFWSNVAISRGYARLFWILMAVSGVLWAGTQAAWVTYEVFLRREVPDLWIGDSLTFLHIVPMIGALAVQPHLSKQEETRPGGLDLALLLLWWVYLYAFLVMPWEYVSPNLAAYNAGYDMLYALEYLAFIAGSVYLVRNSSGAWRGTYVRLGLAAFVHAVATLALNRAIALPDDSPYNYYSGSWYDVPFATSLIFWIYAAWRSRETTYASTTKVPADTYGIWPARVTMAAVLSLPFMALIAVFDDGLPAPVRHFRIAATAVAFFALTSLLFLKQYLLDQRLIRSLRESRDAYHNLQQLQSHLIQAEKLASIGRLVAGAAHEINNPLTAILGYSDLLAGHHGLEDEHKEVADKIRQQARRTKSLVSNLITFARQAPVQHLSVDLNSVVTRGLRLRELDFTHKQITTICELDPVLPRILGDENHLLQVCLHIFSNAVDAMQESHGGGVLKVKTSLEGGRVVLRCADDGPGVANPEQIFDPFYTTKAVGKGTGLGLSACYGIIRDHRGEIFCENLPEGGALFTISLPLAQIQPEGAAMSVAGK